VLLGGLVVGPPGRPAEATTCLPNACVYPVPVDGLPGRTGHLSIRTGHAFGGQRARFSGGLSAIDDCTQTGHLGGELNWRARHASRTEDGELRIQVVDAEADELGDLQVDFFEQTVLGYHLVIGGDGRIEGSIRIRTAPTDAGVPEEHLLVFEGDATILDGDIDTDHCGSGEVFVQPLADGTSLEVPCATSHVAQVECGHPGGCWACGGCRD
jgi:hypothetical protein